MTFMMYWTMRVVLLFLLIGQVGCDKATCPQPLSNKVATPYVNESIALDGVDDQLTVQNATDLNLGAGPFTIEAFFKSNLTTPNGTIQEILSNRTTGFNGFMFGLWVTGCLYVQLGGVPNYGYNMGPVLLDGQCHHVVVTRDNTAVLSFYVDDVLTFQASDSRNMNSPGNWFIGYDQVDGVDNFDGLIDEIRVWNIALSQATLSSNKNKRLQGNEAGLVADWTFSEGTGQTTTDVSGKHTAFFGTNNTVELTDPSWIKSPCLSY
jgi:hypothetical protein